MAELNHGKEIYDLFCECVKQTYPTVKPIPWNLLTKEQKQTWDLLQEKLDQKGDDNGLNF